MRASVGIILLIVGLVVGGSGGYFVSSGQIGSLQSQVSSFQSSNTALQNQISSLQTQVTTLQGNISALQAKLSEANSEIANLNGTYVITISGRAFNPNAITILVGTTVTWTNLDQVDHTVTSSTGVWDSGDIMPNKSFSYTFKTEGSYSYYCGDRPSMTGTVTVTH